MVLRLSLALARSGHLVFIPDLPGIADGELAPATLAASIDYVQAVARRRRGHARPGRPGRRLGRGQPRAARRSRAAARRAHLCRGVRRAVQRHGERDAPRHDRDVAQGAALRAVPGARVPLGGAGPLGDRHPAAEPRRRRVQRRAADARPGLDRSGGTVPRPLVPRARRRSGECPRAPDESRPREVRRSLRRAARARAHHGRGVVTVARRAGPARPRRDRDGSARSVLPRCGVAGARPGLAARAAHGHLAPRTRNAAPPPALPRRARPPERLLRAGAARRAGG